ncbi:MAG: hypothetical protein IKG22_13285 [Atopobiaceae bacterium]|nr:hypothetical protein [Atopobiaceae bacterium]
MPMRCEKYKVFVMPNNLDRWDDSFFSQLGKKQLKRRLDYADDADGTLFRFEDSPLVWRTYLTVVMDKSHNADGKGLPKVQILPGLKRWIGPEYEIIEPIENPPLVSDVKRAIWKSVEIARTISQKSKTDKNDYDPEQHRVIKIV